MIVELRPYTLVPGRRDVLVELFDREFVESQEALGMRVLGTFRDLDREDRFVWLRAFEDMTTRLAGLTAFYSGPVWKEHGALANTTMVDVDDVLLLHPVTDLDLPPARDLTTEPSELVVTVHDRARLPELDAGLGLLETDRRRGPARARRACRRGAAGAAAVTDAAVAAALTQAFFARLGATRGGSPGCFG